MDSRALMLELSELDLARRQAKLTIPIRYPAMTKYSDKTAGGLTKCICDYLNNTGHQAERIRSEGRMVDGTSKYTDVLGHTRVIGSVKFIKSSSQNGTADISATIRGRSDKIEVKIGKDRQSEAQSAYQCKVEQAGGVYVIARSYKEWREWVDAWIQSIT